MAGDSSYIGLIGAMPAEIEPFRNVLSVEEGFQQSTILFYIGRCEDKRIVLARSGVGKVNAAAAAQLMIQSFKPKALLGFGVAGAIHSGCDIGDIVLGEKLIQHDFGWYTAGRFVPEEMFIYRGKRKQRIPWFASHPALVKTAIAATEKALLGSRQVHVGTIVSGDQVICMEEKRKDLVLRYQALATDMESAAIAQVAYMNQVPLLIIRTISDKADLSLEGTWIKKIKLALQARKEFSLAIKQGVTFVCEVLKHINLNLLFCKE